MKTKAEAKAAAEKAAAVKAAAEAKVKADAKEAADAKAAAAAAIAARAAAEKKEKAEDGKKAEEKKEVCGFWFVRASYIREAEWPPGKWKSFQELRDEPDALKPVEISSRAVFSGRGQEKYGEHLAISHRWETPTNPDPSGVQMEEIKQYLKAHRNIKFVWCDYW